MAPKRTPLPQDFSVSDQVMELASRNGWINPKLELDAFKDYHLAHGSLMADWEAAFRTWLRNAAKFNKGPKPFIPTQPSQPARSARSEVPHISEHISEQERRANLQRVQELLRGLKNKGG
jgi:hypothetical protein